MKHFVTRAGLAVVALAAGFLFGQAVWATQVPAAARGAPMAPAASGGYALDWVAAGAIGGGTSASPRHQLNATVGQAAASDSAGSDYRACAGFECVRSLLAQMLPNTRRDASGGW